MSINIHIEYQKLVNYADALHLVELEQKDFEVKYKTKSFLNKQFNMGLNVQRTEFKSRVDELRTCLVSLRKNLIKEIQNMFFYDGIIPQYSGIINENLEMLKNSRYHVTHIEGKTFLRTKVFQLFTGEIDGNGEIILKAVEDKNNMYTVYGVDEFYMDFEGCILPNGFAQFKGRNISDISLIDPPLTGGGRYLFKPSLFSLEFLSDMKCTITADVSKGGIWNYTLMGFRIHLGNFDKTKFLNNAKTMNKGYELFKMDFPLVFQGS